MLFCNKNVDNRSLNALRLFLQHTAYLSVGWMLQEYPLGQSCLFGPRPQKTFGRGTPIWHFGSFAISEFLYLGNLSCMKKDENSRHSFDTSFNSLLIEIIVEVFDFFKYKNSLNVVIQ